MSPALGPYAFLPDLTDFMIHGDTAILAAAAALPVDEYMRPFPVSHGSLHNALVHAMAAQHIWLVRLQSNGSVNPARIEDPTDFPTRESLQTRWPLIHGALRSFVNAQTADTLAAPLTCRNSQGTPSTLPLGQFLLHVTDHGTYHRGQQNTLLKLAGGRPIRLSFYEWRLKNPIA